MDAKTLEKIKSQKYLFRGTNTFIFPRRKKGGFYSGVEDTTSASISLLQALIAGLNRIETDYCTEKLRPLLIAIDALNYIDSLEPGLEFFGPESHQSEILIKRMINVSDITKIHSLDTLVEVYPNAKNYEIKIFRENYL